MSPYERFDDALTEYIDSLKKKRAWKRLEHNRNLAEARGWGPDKLNKYGEWMRHAFNMHEHQRERAMGLFKRIASEMTEQDMERLQDWIGYSKASREAWRRRIVSIDNDISIIAARIAHTIFMIRTEEKVKIGTLIKKARQRG